MDPFEAACAGVLLHAVAGQLAAEHIGAEGVIASDVIAALPRARAMVEPSPGAGPGRGGSVD
jgi:NAD(P)H-hydrate repair Nnr-like enzyme with NAD(P)H-hydrate dehydratase domain